MVFKYFPIRANQPSKQIITYTFTKLLLVCMQQVIFQTFVTVIQLGPMEIH